MVFFICLANNNNFSLGISCFLWWCALYAPYMYMLLIYCVASILLLGVLLWGIFYLPK